MASAPWVWQRAYRKARSFLHHDILNLESAFVEKQPPISVTNQQQQVAMAVNTVADCHPKRWIANHIRFLGW